MPCRFGLGGLTRTQLYSRPRTLFKIWEQLSTTIGSDREFRGYPVQVDRQHSSIGRRDGASGHDHHQQGERRHEGHEGPLLGYLELRSLLPGEPVSVGMRVKDQTALW